MIPKEAIKKNLNNCLETTEFLDLPNRRKGKVRDAYDLGDKLVLITTDRQSAFDRVLASIPFKGQVLNQVSGFWFDTTKDIVANHVLDIPDPNVTIGKKCEVLPIEFVMRGYITGSTSTSAWTQYSNGNRNICGNVLPDGMVKNQKFERPILTPTTKAEDHDESISAEEIVSRDIIDQKTWDRLSEIVFALFERGSQIAAEHGLILVDTKYELGKDTKGEIVLIDEIHTPDSSRYWIAGSYEERFSQGKEPENIDKEFLRLWFKEHCNPYEDNVLPQAPEDLVIELSSRYIQLYEMITGQSFEIDEQLPIEDRLKKNLQGIS
ncbi:MAG: phosphoribosylaminoimidazolesuccinocarboxamide synthase [Chitinivibrionales bacterium]|nr:phosphoribosylaminoimidazolesuccinocarboxamide synthase [Chitinivibrionales bacterium]